MFQMQPFGAVLRLPLGFEVGPQLPIVLRVFVEDEDATGAQAVFEGVEANGGLSLGCVRTGGLLGILPVGFLLFVRNDHTESPFG